MILLSPEKCQGCRICEAACGFHHTEHKAFDPSRSSTHLSRDDYPPKRYWDEPVKTGPYRGEHIDHGKWVEALDEYYRLHGWDPVTGMQTRLGLEELGLKDAADRLMAAGLLK